MIEDGINVFVKRGMIIWDYGWFNDDEDRLYDLILYRHKAEREPTGAMSWHWIALHPDCYWMILEND